MSGHAARFAAAEQRKQDSKSGLRDFAETLPYVLDDFQVTACRSLMDGDSVLVAAPTGSGKTLVGEFAAHLAMKSGRRLFYTTPIKALSNQKFREFQTNLGAENVGLLTGDNSINPGAPIVIMTTEVLRNMLYSADERLADLQFVVMDEVHYLADRFRGAVWEEVMIHLEFIRVNGKIIPAGLPLVRFTTEERLNEIINYHQTEGASIANPHVYTIEEGGSGHINPEQLALKKRVDPYGLMNPGKMKAWLS